MIPGQRKIRGIRDRIKPGQLIGKGIGALGARGHAHPLSPSEVKAFLQYIADEIPNTSAVTGSSVADALTTINGQLSPPIADGDLLANISGGSAGAIGETLSAYLDYVLGSARGDIIFRGNTVWRVLTPGTVGQFLQTNGASADVQWANATGGGGGAGAETLISEVVTSGSQSTVTFSGIAATYRDLRLRVHARGDRNAAETTIAVQFNSDTGTNYTYMQSFTNGAGNTGCSQALTSNGTSIAATQLAAATSSAGNAGGVNMWIWDYRGTTFQKDCLCQGDEFAAFGANGVRTVTTSAIWLSTAAITRVDVFTSPGNFVDGSVVSLYGHF